MDTDVIVVGGGFAGSTLATVLARAGCGVVVLEREPTFRDRVRGENMLPWGVAIARRLGVADALTRHGALDVPYFNLYATGSLLDHRPLPQTTPGGTGCLNMFHPDLQEAMFEEAAAAGADMRRGATVEEVVPHNGGWSVTFARHGHRDSVAAPLIVGADGRQSAMRRWGGFEIRRDPPRLRIAGALVANTCVPEDAAHLCMGPGTATFVAPLGQQRARMYFIYIGTFGDRRLSGRERATAFLEACRATGAPGEWYEGAEVIGPLAEFEGADHAVNAPARPGLALIGDAAAATDPSWGCGLAMTMLDVETLSALLMATPDWTHALTQYAEAHDTAYRKLHDILSWMTELVWAWGPDADERRARVFPRMLSNPAGFPDAIGQGPFGPCDEQARRLLLGEWEPDGGPLAV